MTPELYEQIGQLYQKALEFEPAKRGVFLAEVCGGDEMLRHEVQSLLAAHEQASTFMAQPPDDVAAGWQVAAAPPRQSQLAHYQMISMLGKGGMGEVWLADDSQLHRKVAIKLLPAAFTHDAERVRRFAREAHAASALNHPNILTIHEIGVTENTHYLVTEYVEGETLRQRMTSARPMPLTEALTVAAQMAEALAAAHEAGIIHRDIKPENVMVRRDGLVKVLDFGLAKLGPLRNADFGMRNEEGADTLRQSPDGNPQSSIQFEALPRPQFTLPGIVMGTPRYMSPEQARAEKVDARTDIFSFGVLLYEMVTGRAPFVGATTSDMIAAILKDEPPPLTAFAPDVPPALEHIVQRALRKESAERYGSIHDLQLELKALQEERAFAAQLERTRRAEEPTLPQPQALVTAAPREQTTVPQATTTGMLAPRPRLLLWLAVVGLVVAATTAWLYFKRPPAVPGKDTVLLADFTNQTGDDLFDGMLKLGLATQLGQSPFLNVFPEVRVRQTLRQMERPDDTRVTPELAQEICERQNLKAFIAGSIAPLGSHYVLTLTALRGNNGEELTRTQATATSKEQVLHTLVEAATQLRAQLGESLSSIQQSDQPLEQATTANMQALKAYSESLARLYVGRFAEALPFARRAVELDPQFALAYDQLKVICFVTEQPETASEYVAKSFQISEERALRLKDSVSESERLDSAAWYHLLFTGNQSKQLEYLLLRRQLAPRFAPAHNDLGVSYIFFGQSEQALAPLREAIRLNPNFAAPYRLLARSLIRLNRFAEAKDTLTQAMQLKLEFTEYHTQLYQLAFIGGDAAGMQQQLVWAQGQPEEYVALDWQTGAAAFAGQWRKAQDFSRRAIDLAARLEMKEVAARYATEQALRSAVLGNCQMSKTNAANGLTFGRGRLPLARAALALALCGAASQAQMLAAELPKRFPEDTLSQEVWLPAIRAALHLQRGEAAQALEQLRNTSRYEAAAEFWPQYLRGQAYLQLKQGKEAATEFQKILDHRGYAPLSVLYLFAQLGLARALQLHGDAAKAQQAYADFLTGWEKADQDVPAWNQAQQEKAKLQ